MDTKYFEVFLTRELQARYYVKAEDQDTANDLAWEKFDEELNNDEWDLRPNSPVWEYETQIESVEHDTNRWWLVKDDEGYAVYEQEEEDFLAAVNMGGEV